MSSPYRVITVCTGNICRSPMAEFMLVRALEEAGLAEATEVDSAGMTGWEVGRPVDPRAAATLSRHGIGSEGHRARKFEAAWYGQRDLILALDTDHYEQLVRGAPDAGTRTKVHMLREFDPSSAGVHPSELGIYDPWYGDDADFEATWTLISKAVPGLVAHISEALRER